MKIYLINLDRRPDRRAVMESQAAKAGLCFTRIAALDGQSSESAGVGRWFAISGPLGLLSHNEKCCALSHRAAWTALVESGEDHAVILEDDVCIGSAADALLADDGWVPPDVDVLKLEHFGPENQRVLVTDERKLGLAGFAIGRMASRHTGAGAYLLSRSAAKKLLAVTRFTLPVDHLLFNPNNSPLFAALSPWQMLPPIARQRNFVGAKSDIDSSRMAFRRFGLAFIRREILRGAYECKLVPRQLLLVLSGKGRLAALGGGRPARADRAAPMPAE